jgi:dolichol-phosphate mannosyltransferase
MTPKVSVVIPTIEEEGVFELIKRIKGIVGGTPEIIIVDKSSTAFYNRLKATGAKVIRQKDRGVENALMLGLRSATGSVLCSIDGDGTHDPEKLAESIKMVESGDADLVLGNRLNKVEDGAMSAYLKFGNAALSWMFSVLYKTKVHDVLTGFFVMKKSAFDDIRDIPPYRAGIGFFAIEFAKRGYAIREVDIAYYKRTYGQSKLTRSKFAYGVNVASHLIRQIRDYSPLLIFGGIGVVCIILGLILGAFVLSNFMSTGTFTQVGRGLISFMLVIVGFLSIISGLILDLLLEIEGALRRKKQ